MVHLCMSPCLTLNVLYTDYEGAKQVVLYSYI